MQEVWSGPLAGNTAAMMLVNKADALANVAAPFALTGGALGNCRNMSVFDVFGQRRCVFGFGRAREKNVHPSYPWSAHHHSITGWCDYFH